MKPPARPRPAPGRGTPNPASSKPAGRKNSANREPSQNPPTALPPPVPAASTETAESASEPPAGTRSPSAPVSFAPKSRAGQFGDGGAELPSSERSVIATGLQARIAERAAMARRQRWIRVGWILSAVLFLSGITWAFFFSSMLALEKGKITIEHSETAGVSDTVDIAAVQREVDKAVGTPLPRLATTAMRDKIKDIRGVRDAVLTRDWPRGLHVQITAREPVIAIPDSSGSKDGYVLLDSDAVQVGRLAKPPKDLPVVEVPLDAANSRIVESVLAVVNALPSALSADVAKVEAASQDNISLKLRDGATVRWGGYEGTALKIEVLNTLRNDAEAKSAKLFDVSAPTAPITK